MAWNFNCSTHFYGSYLTLKKYLLTPVDLVFTGNKSVNLRLKGQLHERMLYKVEPLVKKIVKDLYTKVYLNLLMDGLEVVKKL